VLKRETGQRLGVPLHTLHYRHGAFSKGYDDDVGELEEAEVDEEGRDVTELQNLRMTRMGVGNYAVPIDIVNRKCFHSLGSQCDV
jgi:hypothetical protein